MTPLETCPGCGLTKPQDEWPVDVVQAVSELALIVDIGFKCPDCGTVWGHEVS